MKPSTHLFAIQSPSLPPPIQLGCLSFQLLLKLIRSVIPPLAESFANSLNRCRRLRDSAFSPAAISSASDFEMSVLIVTSIGDIVIDLHTDRCPLTTKNFLKLCKMKYYNGVLFHKVEKDFMAQTGDQTGTGMGGDSVYKFLYGEQARFFKDEIHPDLKHSKTGTVAMASAGENCNASQFYITLRDDIDYLDGKHTVFGVVEEKEGLETLAKISESLVDNTGRPFKDIRIKHTYILDDPFEDPPQLAEFIPEKSPEGKPHDETAEERLEDSWVPLDEKLAPEELEELIHAKEAHTNAAILESIGDIPDAEVKPPENVLFVCKLNPVTEDEDLFTIFSRFGTVTSADIIRDYKTGDSLCYAFIEFEDKEACERAYFKMDNALIDDRRIHVDFSQSVSRLWSQFRHGKGSKPKGAGGGCFKCGATDHIARDCVQGDDTNQQPGAKYVLKNDQIQHGGYNGKRYDMVLDEDQNDGQKYQERDRTKKQKTEHSHRSEYSTQKHRYNDEKDKRHIKGDEIRKHESRSYDKHHSRHGSEERSENRERRGHRSSGSNHYGYDDRDYRSDSRGKYERDNRRISERDLHKEDDYHHKNSSKYRDARERSHRDERK